MWHFEDSHRLAAKNSTLQEVSFFNNRRCIGENLPDVGCQEDQVIPS